MWNNITNKLMSLPVNNISVKEYCLSFLSLIDNKYSIMPIHVLQKKLDNTSNIISLTNISSTISDYLNHGNLDLVINCIYHFFDINFSEDYYQPPDSRDIIKAYEEIFDPNSSFYIYKSFYFEPETLLSINKQDNFYLFLFLYFLPCGKKANLLLHPRDNLPLISYCCITDLAFEMLLFLMKTFSKEEFSNLCKNYNLNLMLIENFMNNAKKLYSFAADTNWQEILPLYKISILLDHSCDFSKFTELRDKKNFFTFPNLAIILNDYEKEHQFNKLNKKIPNKQQSEYKVKKI